jgi:hypothetical protein
LPRNATGGLQAIADTVATETLALAYPDAVGGILKKHGWNLDRFGVVTLIGASFIRRANRTAIWVTAMAGGLADLGYLLFADVPGYVHVLPCTLMTFVSDSAIALSSWVWLWPRTLAPAHGSQALAGLRPRWSIR